MTAPLKSSRVAAGYATVYIDISAWYNEPFNHRWSTEMPDPTIEFLEQCHDVSDTALLKTFGETSEYLSKMRVAFFIGAVLHKLLTSRDTPHSPS